MRRIQTALERVAIWHEADCQPGEPGCTSAMGVQEPRLDEPYDLSDIGPTPVSFTEFSGVPADPFPDERRYTTLPPGMSPPGGAPSGGAPPAAGPAKGGETGQNIPPAAGGTPPAKSPAAAPGGGAPSKDLTEALQRAGIDPQMYPLISGFSAAEGTNNAGVPNLGFTDTQAGSTLDEHARALSQQIKDRQQVVGPFPAGGSPQQQAGWMADVVGQQGLPSDWQGNAQPPREQYINNIVQNMPSPPPAAAGPTAAGPTAAGMGKAGSRWANVVDAAYAAVRG